MSDGNERPEREVLKEEEEEEEENESEAKRRPSCNCNLRQQASNTFSVRTSYCP